MELVESGRYAFENKSRHNLLIGLDSIENETLLMGIKHDVDFCRYTNMWEGKCTVRRVLFPDYQQGNLRSGFIRATRTNIGLIMTNGRRLSFPSRLPIDEEFPLDKSYRKQSKRTCLLYRESIIDKSRLSRFPPSCVQPASNMHNEHALYRVYKTRLHINVYSFFDCQTQTGIQHNSFIRKY